MTQHGLETAHPIDMRPKRFVSSPSETIEARNLLDPASEEFVAQQIRDPYGPNIIHFSPPDRTFRSGFPGSSRSGWDPGGNGLSGQERDGNQLLMVTSRLIQMAIQHDKIFTMIAPTRSLLWSMPEILTIAGRADTFFTVTDPLHFSRDHDPKTATSQKVLSNELGFRVLGARGPPDPKITNRRRKDLKEGKRVSRSHGSGKLQHDLVLSWPAILSSIYADPPRTLFEGPSWAHTIFMTVPTSKRKRPLGQPVREVAVAASHKRRRTVAEGIAAGRQMRRQAFEPIYKTELEPGQAADQASKIAFPFDATDALPKKLQETVNYIAEHQSTIHEHRQQAVDRWTQIAKDRAPDSIRFLKNLPIATQKILYRGDDLGSFFHVCLFHDMLKEIGYADPDYPFEMARGLPVVGRVPNRRSGLRTPIPPDAPRA